MCGQPILVPFLRANSAQLDHGAVSFDDMTLAINVVATLPRGVTIADMMEWESGLPAD